MSCPVARSWSCAGWSAVVEPVERDLLQQQAQRGRRDRDQGSDDAHQGAADQDRDDRDHAGDPDGPAHDPGHQQVVLGQPVGDVEAERGDRDGDGDGQRDEGDHGADDGGPDDRDQVQNATNSPSRIG